MNSSLSISRASVITIVFLLIPSAFRSFFTFFHNDEITAVVAGCISLVLIFLFCLKGGCCVKELGVTAKVDSAILIVTVIGAITIMFLPSPSISFLPSLEVKKIAERILTRETGILSFVNMALIAPISEEIVFRGVILRGLLKRYSPGFSISFSAFLFAFSHLSISGPFIYGLFIGWIYYRTQNLLYCIFAHAFANGAFFLARILLSDKKLGLAHYIEQSNQYQTVISILSVFIFSVIILFLARQFKAATSVAMPNVDKT